MSLPIDNSAIEAQHAAEHEYGERLMDLAQERAQYAGASSVTADDIAWAVRTWEHEVRFGESLANAWHKGPEPPVERLKREGIVGKWETVGFDDLLTKYSNPVELPPPIEEAAQRLERELGAWVDHHARVRPGRYLDESVLYVIVPAFVDISRVPRRFGEYQVVTVADKSRLANANNPATAH